jgi:hypothetical protein
MAWVVIAAKLAYGLGSEGAGPASGAGEPVAPLPRATERERTYAALARALGATMADLVLDAAAAAAAATTPGHRAEADGPYCDDDEDEDDTAAGAAGATRAGPGEAQGEGAWRMDARLAAYLPPWEAWRTRAAAWWQGRSDPDERLPPIPWHLRYIA